MARRLGARDLAARASQGLGYVALAEGDLEAANALLEESLAEFRELGDRWWALRGICALGHVAARRGGTRRPACGSRGGARSRANLATRCSRRRASRDWRVRNRPALAARLLGAAESLRELAGAAWPAFVLPTPNAARTGRGAPLATAVRRRVGTRAGDGRRRDLGLARAGPQEHPAGLTLREVDVLRLIATGLTDAQVAERLVLSVRTVHSHVRSTYRKLGVNSRTAATGYVLRRGLGKVDG